MKILTITIPCYNSMEYMTNAINSLLVCKDDVEIIIVNDGSKDETEKIGKEYAEKFPNTVKYIYQGNGGHGEAINTGLKNATGVYFKVLDSDDWFDENCFIKVIETLKNLYSENKNVDMFLSNYVYEKPSLNKTKVIEYSNVFPTNKIFGWSDIGHFHISQNLLMHSIIYRKEILLKSKINLPKHTFYVDNLFAFIPLPYVEKIYYMNVDLYRYYIGREDQSVNEQVMISRINQQIKVNKIMMDNDKILDIENKKLKKYMVKYLSMITAVSTALLIKSGTKENLEKRDELWEYLEKEHSELYSLVTHTLMGSFIKKDDIAKEKMIIKIYNISQKVYNFN